MAYSDPSTIPYATKLPPRHTPRLVTRAHGKIYPVHDHCAFYRLPDGEGSTTIDAGHFHRIRSGRVQPDGSDGHVHYMSNLSCGAGG